MITKNLVSFADAVPSLDLKSRFELAIQVSWLNKKWNATFDIAKRILVLELETAVIFSLMYCMLIFSTAASKRYVIP